MVKNRPSVFLSYSSKDKAFARKLANRLMDYGVRAWLFEVEIGIGKKILEEIANAIDKTDYFAVVLSTNSINSEWVQKELQMAMDKELKKRKVIVLPLLLEDVKIPLFLRDKRYADFTTPEKIDENFPELLKALEVSESLKPSPSFFSGTVSKELGVAYSPDGKYACDEDHFRITGDIHAQKWLNTGNLDARSKAIESYKEALDYGRNRDVEDRLKCLEDKSKECLQEAMAVPLNALEFYCEADHHRIMGDIKAERAIISNDKELLEEAIQSYEKALECAEDYADVYAHLGVLYSIKNEKQKAEQFLQKALRINKNHPAANMQKAINREAEGNIEEAVDACNLVIQHSQDSKFLHPNAHILLGKIYMERMDKLSEAEKEFKKAEKKNPDFPSLNAFLGMLYLRKDRLEEAENCFWKIIDSPTHSGYAIKGLEQLSASYGHKMNLQKSREILRKLMEKGKGDTAKYKETLQALNSILGDQGGKMGIFKRRKSPGSTIDESIRDDLKEAKSSFSQKRYDDALTRYTAIIPRLEEILKSNSRDAEAHLELSGALWAKLLIAKELPPGPQRTQAMAEIITGQYPIRIKQALEKYLELAPKNDPKREAAKRLLDSLGQILK